MHNIEHRNPSGKLPTVREQIKVILIPPLDNSDNQSTKLAVRIKLANHFPAMIFPLPLFSSSPSSSPSLPSLPLSPLPYGTNTLSLAGSHSEVALLFLLCVQDS